MKTKKNDKTTKRLAVFAVLSVIIFILTAIIAFVYFFVDLEGEREIIEIPGYVGRQFCILNAGDRIKFDTEAVFSNDIPAGEVISQIPYAGARRKLADGEKYTVKLTVSMGKESQSVPYLVGMSYNAAAMALRAIGARIKIVSVYDDKTERDTVLKTLPAAGGAVARGDTVTVFVSRNHVHSPVCVKNYVGRAIESASVEILAQGLTLGEISFEYNEALSEGMIISQSLAPEALVAHGSRMDIVVSGGKRKEELHPFRGEFTEKNGEINGND